MEKSVKRCGKCQHFNQCKEGTKCCSVRKLCVDSCDDCKSKLSADCTSGCSDNQKQSDCKCGNKKFPKHWAPPCSGIINLLYNQWLSHFYFNNFLV